MNGQMLLEEIREAKETELERLGSEKALLAATGADLSEAAILSRIAHTLDGLGAVFEEWADVDTAFGEAAASLGEESERAKTALDGVRTGEPPVPLPTVRTLDGDIERVAGGLVAHGMVFDGLCLQAVSFFVNEADERHADLCRDLRSSANSRIDTGAEVLDSRCTDDADWERARTAASEVIEAAYRDYVESLDGMGIDPKPVC